MPSQAPNHAVPATVMLVVDGAPVGKGGVPQSIAVPGADEQARLQRLHTEKGQRPKTNLPEVRAMQEESNTLNIIVAGHQGLGKTTACRSMFNAFQDDSVMTAAATSYQTQECRQLQKQIREQQVKFEETATEEKLVAKGLGGRERDTRRAMELKAECDQIAAAILELKKQLEAAHQTAVAKATPTFTINLLLQLSTDTIPVPLLVSRLYSLGRSQLVWCSRPTSSIDWANRSRSSRDARCRKPKPKTTKRSCRSMPQQQNWRKTSPSFGQS